MTISERGSRFADSLTKTQLPMRLQLPSLMPGDAAARDVAQHANAIIRRERDDFRSTKISTPALSASLGFSEELEERWPRN